MEQLGQLLNAFYTQPLSAQDRSTIHQTLLQSLTDSSYHQSCITYITQIVHNPTMEIDPYLLHHSLHILETLARTKFSSIPRNDIKLLESLLLDLLTSAHLRDNNKTEKQQVTIPQYVLNKAAAALVSIGKRNWLTNDQQDILFPNGLLKLINSPGHTPKSLSYLLAGNMLITTLLDDTLASNRRDLLHCDLIRLKKLIAVNANHFLYALEIAQRAAGPLVPKYIIPSSIRSISNLCKLQPNIISDALTILSNSLLNRYDHITSNILLSIIDILSISSSSTLHINSMSSIVNVIINLLQYLTTNNTNNNNNNNNNQIEMLSSLLTVTESIVKKLIVLNDFNQIEQVLNAFMGLSFHLSSNSPFYFIKILDCWMNLFEIFEDEDKLDEDFIQLKLLPSVANLCKSKMFFVSNQQILTKLKLPANEKAFRLDTNNNNNNSNSNSSVCLEAQLKEWHSLSEIIPDVIKNPFGSSSTALFFNNLSSDADVTHDDVDDDDQGDNENEDSSFENDESDNLNGFIMNEQLPVMMYINKCIEILSLICQFSKQQGIECAKTVCEAVSVRINDGSIEGLIDIHTSICLAYALGGGILPEQVGLTIVKSISQIILSGGWKFGKIGIIGLRTICSYISLLKEDKVIIGDLIKTCNEILIQFSNHKDNKIGRASAWLLICIDEIYRNEYFTNEPPISIELTEKKLSSLVEHGNYDNNLAILLLELSSIINWIIIPKKNENGIRLRWRDEEWKLREMKLKEVCTQMFSLLIKVSKGEIQNEHLSLKIIAIQSIMLKNIILCVQNVTSKSIDAIWRSCCFDISKILISLLDQLCTQLLVSNSTAALNDPFKKDVTLIISNILKCMDIISNVCNRCSKAQGISLSKECIKVVMKMMNANNSTGSSSNNHSIIARESLKLMRDQIANGDVEMMQDGFNISISCIERYITTYESKTDSNDDDELCEISLSLINEGLKRHWRLIWPDDTVSISSAAENTTANNNSNNGNEIIKALYFKCLQSIIKCLKCRQLSICRYTLLSLQQLHASRKLYARAEAFQNSGAANVVIVECFIILGAGGDSSRESLSDEAVEIIWGIARVDFNKFYSGLHDILCQVVGNSIDPNYINNIVQSFQGVDDRSTFCRNCISSANDMVYYMSLVPSL